MVEVLLIVLLVISVGPALFLHRTFEVCQRQAALPHGGVRISYVVWILEFGDEYRFLIPIELLSFTLIFIVSRRSEIKLVEAPGQRWNNCSARVRRFRTADESGSLGMVGNLFQRNRAKSAVAPVGGLSHAWEQSI